MYHFFQAHMKKIFWALLFLIIPPFCFFGNFSMGSREKVVGEMYGKPVKENQFQRAYNAVSLEALLRYGENYHKFLKFLNLDQQAWDRMILLKKAKDMDIEVSDSELRNYLVKLFSVPGEKGPVFDNNRYEAFVTQHLRIPLNQFEHMARESLSIQKLADEIEKNVTISSAEAEAFFREEENKIEFVYAKVESRLFENKVEVSDDKLEEYFKNHSDDFQIPEQVRLNTVLILKDSIQKDQVVSEEEMRAYYEENRESFTESKPAEKSGEVKENDTTPSYKSFESVKEEIRKRLTGIKTEEAGENVSDALYRQMVEKNNFADVAKGNSLEIKQTEWFSRPNPPQEIGGASSQQVRDAFDLTVKDFCGPYRVNNGWLILEVDAKEPSRSPSDWKEVRHLVEEAYRKTQAPLLAEKEAEILRQKVLAHSEKNFEQAVNLLGGVCGVSGLVSMKSGYIAGLGSHKEVLEKAFKLKENEFSEIIPVDNRAKFIFCQVVKRVSPDMEKFQKNKDKVRERALEEKRQKELYQWMNTVRKEAAVKVTAERTNAAVPPDTAEED